MALSFAAVKAAVILDLFLHTSAGPQLMNGLPGPNLEPLFFRLSVWEEPGATPE